MRACVGFPDFRRELVFLLELPEDALALDGAADEGVKRQPPEKKVAAGRVWVLTYQYAQSLMQAPRPSSHRWPCV